MSSLSDINIHSWGRNKSLVFTTADRYGVVNAKEQQGKKITPIYPKDTEPRKGHGEGISIHVYIINRE